MCRIAGYIEKKSNIEDTSIIETMFKMIWHGGPDDNGYELFPFFFLMQGMIWQWGLPD